jgi:hypothetical protein
MVRNATVAWVTALLPTLGATSTLSSEEWCMIERRRRRIRKGGDRIR